MATYYKLKNGNILEVAQDDYHDNPRSWDNITKMVCFHNRYDLGDKHTYNKNDFNSWEELKKAIETNENVAIIQPLYLYDHSGITISTSTEYPFNDRWDSMCVGFVYVTKETLRKEYNTKKVTKNVIEKAENILLGEVENYDTYLRGEIYVAIEIENKTGNVLDSCGGFFGYDPQTNGMEDYFDFDSFVEVTVKKHEILEIVE